MNDILFEIFSQISDGIIATDADGKVLFLNSYAEKLTGWSLDNAIGQPAEKVFNAIDQVTRKELSNPVYDVIRTGNSSEMSNHTVLKNASGGETIIEKCGIPIKGEKDKILGAILVLKKCNKDNSAAKTNFNSNSFSKRVLDELTKLICSISEKIFLFKNAGWPGSNRLETLEDMLSKSIYMVKLLSDNFKHQDTQGDEYQAKHFVSNTSDKPVQWKDSRLGHILVMDDDQMLRQLATRCLGRLGYHVTTVADGEEALHVYRYSFGKRTFDAVIVDLTIKNGMGGLETLRGLKNIEPDVKTIITSGYTNDPILQHYQAYGFNEVMYKPFGLLDLDRTLNKVLG